MNALNIKRGFWRKWGDISGNVGRTPLGSTPDTAAYASSLAGHGTGTSGNGVSSGGGTDASARISRINSDSPHSYSGIPTSGSNGHGSFSNEASPHAFGSLGFNSTMCGPKGAYLETTNDSPENIGNGGSIYPTPAPAGMPGVTYMDQDLGRKLSAPPSYFQRQGLYPTSTKANMQDQKIPSNAEPGSGLNKDMAAFFDAKMSGKEGVTGMYKTLPM